MFIKSTNLWFRYWIWSLICVLCTYKYYKCAYTATNNYQAKDNDALLFVYKSKNIFSQQQYFTINNTKSLSVMK